MLSCILLTSCTEVDVIRCTDTTVPAGYLQIYPNQDTHTLPALTYHFYNMDGRTECMTSACDGRGNFEGKLPVGTYRVIAVNPKVTNVKFSGMDSYETAMATTTKLTPDMPLKVTEKKSTTRASHPLNVTWSVEDWQKSPVGPGDVYLVNLGDFELSGSDTLRHEPAPRLLTRWVRIRFLLGANLLQKVSGIEGTLCGVYPSVRLFGGAPCLADNTQDISTSTISFEAACQEQEWSALVSVFGLCHPDYGVAYTSTLDLTLTFSDSRKASARADLTDQLSDIIDQSDGVIPVTLSLELEIEPDEAGITVGIAGWEEDGGGEVELI